MWEVGCFKEGSKTGGKEIGKAKRERKGVYLHLGRGVEGCSE